LKKICDLHTHSDFSDGKYTPTELIEEALEKKISAIALSDHNTIDGLGEFLEAARGKDIMAIPAIELSSDYNGKELHIVGLFIPVENFPKVTEFLKEYREAKDENNRRTVELLKEDGYDISYDDIISRCRNGNVNRIHIAEVLMEKGYAKSIKECFKGLLSKKEKYYKPSIRPTAQQAVEFLKSIDAIPVIAHPFLDLSPEQLVAFIEEMKPWGLVAMETLYSTYSEETTKLAIEIANKTGLKQSGGSDFHGSNKPTISLGSGEGNSIVPFELVEELMKKY
jgi:predicted metal-dependent phosphoesterase TrpH